jgi:hypothetical protein
VMPTPPAQAVAAGLTNVAFSEDFLTLNGIDLGNTGGPGFNFYLQCNFAVYANSTANTAQGTNELTFSTIPSDVANGWQVIDSTSPGSIPPNTLVTNISGSNPYTVTLSNNVGGTGVSIGDLIAFFVPPQPASTLSISSPSVLEITNVGQGNNNFGLTTTYLKTAGPGIVNTFNGFVASGGWYAEISMAFDETLSPNLPSGLSEARWPALSAYSWPGTLYNTSSDEWDLPDCLPAGAGAVALSFYLHENSTVSVKNYADQWRGTIATFGSLVGGSGYVSGTYANVQITGNGEFSGVGLATITVSGGSVTNVVVQASLRVSNGEVFTCTNSWLGGSGSGFSFTVTSTGTLVLSATQFHKYGTLNIPDTGNGGSISFYFDGIMVGETTTSLTGGSNPEATNDGSGNPDNYNGVFTAYQTNGSGFNFVIASGCAGYYPAGNWPLYVDYFNVFN